MWLVLTYFIHVSWIDCDLVAQVFVSCLVVFAVVVGVGNFVVVDDVVVFDNFVVVAVVVGALCPQTEYRNKIFENFLHLFTGSITSQFYNAD